MNLSLTMNPNTNIVAKAKGNKPGFSAFLQNHKIGKDAGLPSTNTRIGDGVSIFAGNFHIPEEEYGEFLNLYYSDVVSQKRPEYLTEAQLKTDGPILVDLDFRFDYACAQRYYTKDHIDDLITEYLEQLKTMYQFDADSQFQIFVLEKPHINRVEEKQITKDGLHLIIAIRCERKAQIVLRTRMVEKLKEMWGGEDGLPLTNTFEEVLDDGISLGHTNWQLYGSGKPNHEAYRLTYVYNIVGFDTADSEFQIRTVDVASAPVPMEEYIHKLSARCSSHPAFFYTTNFANALNSVKDAPARRGARNAVSAAPAATMMDILTVRNAADLEAVSKAFLESITDSDYELRETWEYTMVLPAEYYENGSYSKWIRVGWALRNIDDRLFVLWVAFSAKAARFDYTSIHDMYDQWLKFDMKNPNGLTKRSIMHWAKEDARADYVRIREASTDFAIERSLGSYELLEDGKPDKRGCTDHDIATILHQLYKAEYVCSSITNNLWWKYEEPRWVKIDAGVYLRRHISNELRAIYNKKAAYYMELRSRLREGDDAHRIKKIAAHTDKIMSIYTRLGNSSDKKNIMTEAKELFYNDRFEEKLDANPYLFCFKNGVVDFKEKVFRRGHPEDHLTKCNGINFIDKDVETCQEYAPIIAEIRDFMRKLFPIPELHDYMWEHLASTLVGVLPDQTWNIYLGEGQNGKSVLVKLMEYVLGEYKGVVPLSLLTDRRTKIGGTSPEVIGLQGLRYAVMQEPTKGERVNEGVMKQLVSGIDPIQARGLYMQHAISFYPQFKLVLCSNYLMDIKSNDHGTWRRIRVVPFVSLFTENPSKTDPDKPYQFKIDRTLEERVRDWKEIFATMLVKKAFLTDGRVKDCATVLEASNTYRRGQDNIAEFMAEYITADPNGRITPTDLTFHLNNWKNENGFKDVKNKEVKDILDKKYKKVGKDWVGCRLMDGNTNQTQVEIGDIPDIDFEEE